MKPSLRHVVLPLIAAGFLAHTAAANVQARASTAVPDANVVAQLWAGIEPAAGDPRIDRIVAAPEWRAHRDWVRVRWDKVQSRLTSMSRWREESLSMSDGGECSRRYRFSGPDFLNANAMFPDHPRYAFFSLEKPGSLPAITTLNERQQARVLEDVRAAPQDIFERSYFVTD